MNTEQSIPAMISPEEIAKRLGISRSAAYRLCKTIGAYQINRSLRVAERDLAAYLESRRVEVAR